MSKIKTKQKKILKGSKGITLIALVITIIVLLILAAVSIATLTGDNGILTKAQDASERTKESTAREQIEEEAVASFDDNGKFNRETFKKRIEDIGGTVLSDDGNEIKVELDGYEVVIDAKTGKIKNFGKGVTPVVKATQGETVEGKVTIKIEVTNDVDTVDSVTVTNLDTGKTYPASFNGKSGTAEVDSNGTYKVEVKATTEGVQKTGETTIGVIVTPVAFTKKYGKIDVIWVNTNNEKIDKPLAPVLNGENPMKKVYWKDGVEVKEGEAGFTESEWYDYVAGDNDADNTKSHWANAINTVEGNDGYFVWIPRYAYRIIYYADKECTKVAGYCDGDGTREVDGTIYNNEKAKAGIETVEYNGFKYIVHPAFETNTDIGGWNEDLSGIWVGKYESARNTATADNFSDYGGDGMNIKIVPNVTSWRKLEIPSFYNISKKYDKEKKSHLMKNSEWGAVAYLTHSQYGRNGKEVNINNSSNCITGSGKDTEDKNLSSSTGNEYGVFDLSGGAYEYVAAYYEGKTYEGANTWMTGETEQQYVTKYNSSSSTPNYESYYPGDATYEVGVGVGSAWFDDYCYFIYSLNPFFSRGGCYLDKLTAGVFYSNYDDGDRGVR